MNNENEQEKYLQLTSNPQNESLSAKISGIISDIAKDFSEIAVDEVVKK